MSLPRLDFSVLAHNAAKWPLPARGLLGCALAGLVLVVGDIVHLGSAQERLHRLEAQEAVLQQQLAQKTALTAGLDEQVRQFTLTQAQVDGLLRQLPGESEMPGLLEDIARLAAATGVVLENVSPMDEQLRSFYSEQPVQLGVFGAYHDLATFVSGLGGLSRFATVHDITLRRDGTLLRLDLLAKSYWHPHLGSRSGAPVLSGPAFVYAAAGLRDPFQPPALQVAYVPGRAAPAPDLTRPRGPLENIAVNRFQMAGTLARGAHAFALLRVASEVHRLSVGDYLGPDHGRITAIHDDHIELVELFPDERGAWLERPRTLELNVNS